MFKRDPQTGQMHDDPECRCVERYGRVKCQHCGQVVLWCCSYTMYENECAECGPDHDPYLQGDQ